MSAGSPLYPIEPPAFLRDISPYRDLRPLALEPQLTATLGLDPAHTYVAAAASQESVPALVAYYQSQLAAAGWQIVQKAALTGQEQAGIQIVFSRAQGHGLQTLILLCATPQSLAGNSRTAALAGKLPPGSNLLLEAAPIPSNPSGESLQPDTHDLPQGVAAENLSFDLVDGWTTSAQITYPSHGKGPYPTLVLVHGSGKNDMDETLPEAVAGVPGGSKFFRPIALRLPQRGFAVLRYNKRGVIGLGPQLSQDRRFLSFPLPFKHYLNDARAILEQARGLKQIDPNRLLLLGHSEGTVLSSLIARSEEHFFLAGPVIYPVRLYARRGRTSPGCPAGFSSFFPGQRQYG